MSAYVGSSKNLEDLKDSLVQAEMLARLKAAGVLVLSSAEVGGGWHSRGGVHEKSMAQSMEQAKKLVKRP